MSEIGVHRTAGGGRCLIIDGTRVAGGKPEFSGDNCVCWWETDTTIGVVDDLEAKNEELRDIMSQMAHDHAEQTCEVRALKAENAKLREFARCAYSFSYNCYHGAFDQEVFFDLRDRMREVGIEVG